MSSVTVDWLQKIHAAIRGDEEAVPGSGTQHVPNSDRTLATTRDRIQVKGTLLSVNVQILSGVPRVGQVHVRVILEDFNQKEEHTLCMGYVYPGHEVFGSGGLPIKQGDSIRLESRSAVASIVIQPTWRILPNRFSHGGGWSAVMKGSLEGPGSIRVVGGTVQAVNTNISETVPTNARWRLFSVQYRFVTSSQVASRTSNITIDDGSTAYLIIIPAVAQADTLTRDYNYFDLPSVGREVTTNSLDTIQAHLPVRNMLQAHRIRTSTQNIKSLDNYGAPVMHLEEWIEE